MTFLEVPLPEFEIGPDDFADLLVTVVRRHGCDDVVGIEFERRTSEMTGAERALVHAWVEANEHEFDEMIEAARQREEEMA